MAEALISGFVKSGLVPADRLTAADVREERLAQLRSDLSVRTATDNRQAARDADIIFLALKPQVMPAVLEQIGPALRPSQLVVSIAAGITIGFIEKHVPQGTPVIRTMPNTPALLGAGMIVLAGGRLATREHFAVTTALFSTTGVVLELPEDKLDAVTALSGSGPAYVFYLAEAMEQAGVAMGLDAATARTLSRQTVYGAGRMLATLPEDATGLRRSVTSPGGTTAAAIASLEKDDFFRVMREALQSAQKRAGELAR
jgi:pyrroline-5-carboxylate reductase